MGPGPSEIQARHKTSNKERSSRGDFSLAGEILENTTMKIVTSSNLKGVVRGQGGEYTQHDDENGEKGEFCRLEKP